MKTAARLTRLVAAATLALTACGQQAGEPASEPAGGAWDPEGTTTAPASASEGPGSSDESDGASDDPSPGEPADATTPSGPAASDDIGSDGPEDGPAPEAGPGAEATPRTGAWPSSPTPSAASSSRLSAAGREQQARLEEMAPSILLAEDLPGDVLVGQERRAAVDMRFEMNMYVRGVETEGECSRLIRRIDDFSRPGSAVGYSQYEVDQDAEGVVGEAEAFAAAVITRHEEDVMGMFGRLPEVCGEVEGPEARGVFEPIDGLPGASRLVLEADGERIELLMGGVTDGDEHLYTGYVNIETELAEQMLREQVAAFEARPR